MLKFSWSLIHSADIIEHVQHSIDNDPDKSPFLAGPVVVKECDVGDKSPDITIQEIHEMTEERIEMSFNVAYSGDAHILVNTCVQANPATLLNDTWPGSLRFARPRMTGVAAKSFVLPMEIKISKIRLNADFYCVADRNKGVVLVVKPDPVIDVTASSSLDNIPGVASMIYQEILFKIRLSVLKDIPNTIKELTEKQQDYKKLTQQLQRIADQSDGDGQRPPTLADQPFETMEFSPLTNMQVGRFETKIPEETGQLDEQLPEGSIHWYADLQSPEGTPSGHNSMFSTHAHSSTDTTPVQSAESSPSSRSPLSNSFSADSLPPPYMKHPADTKLENRQTLSLSINDMECVALRHLLVQSDAETRDNSKASPYTHQPKRRIIKLGKSVATGQGKSQTRPTKLFNKEDTQLHLLRKQ